MVRRRNPKTKYFINTDRDHYDQLDVGDLATKVLIVIVLVNHII